MRNRKGFTLIELMVVIFIVGILAAVAIPIMRGRIDSAKWSEAKAAMGSIRTAARAYEAEKGSSWTYTGTALTDLGFVAAGTDLDGKYFSHQAYTLTFNAYDTYSILCTAALSTCAEKPTTPATETLDQTGTFTP
ncbi:MAG: type II secretion system protein [Sedimentisphaerales bacterium]|jgi:prepilin-type N-terminal cleavage/methylation domain-containing protein